MHGLSACKRKCEKKRKIFTAQAMDKQYPIKDLITCATVGVVYMLECDCGLQYVGRTSRHLHNRIAEYVNNIKKRLVTHKYLNTSDSATIEIPGVQNLGV